MIRLGVAGALAALMAAETWWSARNESRLRARGAAEPPGDVYRAMQVAYPGSFLAMAAEGWLRAPAAGWALAAGLAVLVAAKALKYWAIATLGERWCFRVLVPPGAPLVAGGPYRFLTHPNYLGVCGELLGAAMVFSAPVTGALAVLGFGALIRRRVAVEDAALRRGASRPDR